MSGTSYDVTGIEANIDYYYTVCSKRNGETSNTSNTITVIRKLKTPVTLPATNVASYGFTANWQSLCRLHNPHPHRPGRQRTI